MAMDELIAQYIKDEYLDDDDNPPGLDRPLISSGIVDSFSMVSLKAFLENKFSIKIPDEKATPDAFDTVRKIMALVLEYAPDAK